MLPPPDLDSPPEPDFTIASTLGSEEIRAGAGGYDYGWPDATVAIADPRFIDLLNSAEINAVSYALVPAAGGRALPQVDLVAEKAEPLREAFALFERWRAMSGVGSISVSIAPEKTGYTLLIGTDLRALRWRCCGFQNVTSPEAFSLTWAKTLDTRNDFVSSLEAYARNVVAPAFLGAAQLGRTDTGEIVAKALPGVDPILLPGIGWGAPAGWAGRDRTGISEDSGREGDAAPRTPRRSPEHANVAFMRSLPRRCTTFGTPRSGWLCAAGSLRSGRGIGRSVRPSPILVLPVCRRVRLPQKTNLMIAGRPSTLSGWVRSS